jgi:protein gp37
LLETPSAVRFVSYEPALGWVNFTLWMWADKRLKDKSLDWIIVGGESGPGARPFDIQWARNTIAQCEAAGVACFVKQVGSRPVEHGERWRYEPKISDRKGGDIEEWPADLRVREFPKKEVRK